MDREVPAKWRWFNEARFGMFIHFGPYAEYGRGEQVLFREHLDQRQYSERACRWNPTQLDTDAWAQAARRAGMRYAVLTARHHDGFCLWDSKQTDYTITSQSGKRDIVAEYVESFRRAGLKVGLYYSLADWRIPAYFDGPLHDPDGWETFRSYCHEQVRELLTNYGRIDLLWFDGCWPHPSDIWRSSQLVEMIRSLQPEILINNRLGAGAEQLYGKDKAGWSKQLGDFGTPEHEIVSEPGRLWESCQTTTWRLWGYAVGERWRSSDQLLDTLCCCASDGGNLLLNVGPDADGRLPQQFVEPTEVLGEWLAVHGEAVYGSEPGGQICEFITYGYQTHRGNDLYLIIRFWDGSGTLRLAGLQTKVLSATLLTTGEKLKLQQSADELTVNGLPVESPTQLFPVVKLSCESHPQPRSWAKDQLWEGDPRRMTSWAARRGTSVLTDGSATD